MQQRVTLFDYGTCIDALDRPGDHDGAVMLGHAYKINGHGWYVCVTNRTHTAPGLTKKQAKALLRNWARQALTPDTEAAGTASP